MSGLIAFALSQSPGGAYKSLRDCVVEVLETANVVEALPPGPQDPKAVKVRNLLDVLLPKGSKKALRRKEVLLQNLHGDIDTDDIRVFSNTPLFSVEKWAGATAAAILPHRTPLFQRRRWISSLRPVRETALLSAIHRIAQRAIPKWIAKVKDKNVEQYESEQATGWQGIVDAALRHDTAEHGGTMNAVLRVAVIPTNRTPWPWENGNGKQPLQDNKITHTRKYLYIYIYIYSLFLIYIYILLLLYII